MRGGHTPSLRRGVQRVVDFGERPAQSAVENVAAGHAQPLFQVQRGRGLDARPAVGVGQQGLLNGFSQNGIQRRKHRLGECVASGPEHRVWRVQTEYGQGRGARIAQRRRQDGRVGQRVAVDLARKRIRQRIPGGPVMSRVELCPGLVHVERATERLLGCDIAVAQTRQSPQHHVDFDLSARRGGWCGVSQQAGQCGRRDPGQHEPATHHMLVVVPPITHLTARVDPVNLCAGDDLGAVGGRGGGQRRADCAHPTDGDVPVADPAAQQVVQKADVLLQRRVVELGEGPDQRVGRHHTAHQVVIECVDDRGADRPLGHVVPRPGRIRMGRDHGGAGLFAGAQRLQQRGPQPFGDQPAAPVELSEAVFVAVGADRVERAAAADQQAGTPGRHRVGAVRRIRPWCQPYRRAEVVEDGRRQQAHQIGVPGQPGRHTVEHLRRHRGAADVRQPLQQLHPLPGAGQVCRGDQAVVPAADDDRVDVTRSQFR